MPQFQINYFITKSYMNGARAVTADTKEESLRQVVEAHGEFFDELIEDTPEVDWDIDAWVEGE